MKKSTGIVVGIVVIVVAFFLRNLYKEIKKAPYGDLDEINDEPVGI